MTTHGDGRLARDGGPDPVAREALRAAAAPIDITSMPGTGPLDYELLPGLDGVVIEGCFVLDIVVEPGTVSFLINAALKPFHPWYAPPEASAAHCFRRLRVVFRSVRKAEWFEQSDRTYQDADGRRDRGCIDRFTAGPDGRYTVQGDWGGLTIESASPSVLLFGPAPEAASEHRLQLDAWLAGALPPGT